MTTDLFTEGFQDLLWNAIETDADEYFKWAAHDSAHCFKMRNEDLVKRYLRKGQIEDADYHALFNRIAYHRSRIHQEHVRKVKEGYYPDLDPAMYDTYIPEEND